jgi:hypothetical protein
MKAASGDTDNGGDINVWPMVDGLSEDMLWVLDLMCRGGEAMPDEGLDIVESTVNVVMLDYISRPSAGQCTSCRSRRTSDFSLAAQIFGEFSSDYPIRRRRQQSCMMEANINYGVVCKAVRRLAALLQLVDLLSRG